MKKKMTHLPAPDLVQLNQGYSDAELAKEKLAHATTRHQHTEALRDAAKLQRELLRVTHEAKEATACKESAARMQQALDAKNAAAKRWDDLVADLRQRYSIEPGQGIDPISGELIAKDI